MCRVSKDDMLLCRLLEMSCIVCFIYCAKCCALCTRMDIFITHHTCSVLCIPIYDLFCSFSCTFQACGARPFRGMLKTWTFTRSTTSTLAPPSTGTPSRPTTSTASSSLPTPTLAPLRSTPPFPPLFPPHFPRSLRRRKCPEYLRHKMSLMSPSVLAAARVPVHKVVQEQVGHVVL